METSLRTSFIKPSLSKETATALPQLQHATHRSGDRFTGSLPRRPPDDVTGRHRRDIGPRDSPTLYTVPPRRGATFGQRLHRRRSRIISAIVPALRNIGSQKAL